MHTIFHVATADIKALNDAQARELIARLCRADIRKVEGSESAVTWGGDQRAKDGGVDVWIEVKPPLGLSGYLPHDNTAFQVKAEAFPPGKISGEMAPKGQLRPAIRDLAITGGSYVIVSTRDDTSKSALDQRLHAMRQCLVAGGLDELPRLDFYDARKVADWVEQHPAIVAWVKNALGKPLEGWRPYSGWAYQETTIESEYLIDDRIKVFTPGSDKGIDVSSTIDCLRADLGGGKSVRVVGLSGVGKTRLVQALFDPRVTSKLAALSADAVIYTDLADGPTPQPSAMLEALIEEGSQCVLVVDNCGADTHQRLTELLLRANDKIGLITVEYDVRDDLPDTTRCYRLEGSSDDVIKRLLQRRFPVLSISDVDVITAFSDGNARVAFALAATVTTTGQLARLRDSDLFNRLFHQNQIENDSLISCAEAASILYSFDGEDEDHGSELNKIAEAAGTSLGGLKRALAELGRRGLVQARGKWRAILPHAIANRLACQALETIPKSVLMTGFAESSSDRVARSFSRRLGYLHESAKAIAIVDEWLQPKGRLGDLTSLDKTGHEVFENIAPVSPKSALAAIVRAADVPSFLSVENDTRGKYAQLLRSIAFDAENFDSAVAILVRFALGDPKCKGHISTVDIFKSLFYCVLSGTNALPEQRAAVVVELLESGDVEREQLGMVALDAAFETNSFTSTYMFDFGARKRSEGWIPKSRIDVQGWYTPFIGIAQRVGKQNTAVSQQCRTILGRRIRGLWSYAKLKDEVRVAIEDISSAVGWPEAWFGVREILQYDIGDVDEYGRNQLRELDRLLRPTVLKEKIQARLSAPDPYILALDDEKIGRDKGSRKKLQQSASSVCEALGEEAANDQELLEELLPLLLAKNPGINTFDFGIGVGLKSGNPTRILSQAKKYLQSDTTKAVSVFFLRGLIKGWYQTSPAPAESYLDASVGDDVWSEHFMSLQCALPMNCKTFARTLRSIESCTNSAWQYSVLGWGRTTDSLTIEQIFSLLSAIAPLTNGGEVSLEVISMVIHCASDRDDVYKASLATASLQLLQVLKWEDIFKDRNDPGHRIKGVLAFALQRVVSFEIALGVLDSLVRLTRATDRSYGAELFVKEAIIPFLKYLPVQTLDRIYISDESGHYLETSRIIGRPRSDEMTSLHAVPTAILLDWCNASPVDRYNFAASNCQLFGMTTEIDDECEPVGSSDNSKPCISDVALALLSEAQDKSAIVVCYLKRFIPTGYSGSLAEILKKRIPILDELNPDNDEPLRLLLADAKRNLEQRIVAEERREDADERERTGSFE